MQRLVGSLAFPHTPDHLWRIQDVSEAENHRAPRMCLLERRERRYQFALGAPRHVIDQDQVGSEAPERVAQQVCAQSNELSLVDPETSRFPTARADLADGGELDMVHALGKLKKGSDGGIGEQQDVAVLPRLEKGPADEDIPPQMAQTQTVLGVD